MRVKSGTRRLQRNDPPSVDAILTLRPIPPGAWMLPRLPGLAPAAFPAASAAPVRSEAPLLPGGQ